MTVENKFIQFLLAAVATGFIAWSGVVWSTGDRLTGSINVVLLKLTQIESTIAHLSAELDEHESLKWHGEVGLELDRLKRYHK